MPREQFLYPGTQQLCDLLDEAGRRAGVSRGQVFEDFLTCTVCTLSNRQMEDEYLAVVRNSLAGEVKLGYRTGFNLAGGFIRPLEPGELRRPVVPDDQSDAPEPPPMRELPPGRIAGGLPRQLPLF
jgi:hypothetical protein